MGLITAEGHFPESHFDKCLSTKSIFIQMNAIMLSVIKLNAMAPI
jgi:hypothetical protein